MVIKVQVLHLEHIFQNLCRNWDISNDAGPDLWMKAEYYSYILCYMDDKLCIHQDPDGVLNKLDEMSC